MSKDIDIFAHVHVTGGGGGGGDSQNCTLPSAKYVITHPYGGGGGGVETVRHSNKIIYRMIKDIYYK